MLEKRPVGGEVLLASLEPSNDKLPNIDGDVAVEVAVVAEL